MRTAMMMAAALVLAGCADPPPPKPIAPGLKTATAEVPGMH